MALARGLSQRLARLLARRIDEDSATGSAVPATALIWGTGNELIWGTSNYMKWG